MRSALKVGKYSYTIFIKKATRKGVAFLILGYELSLTSSLPSAVLISNN
uniref:Uncharacterized protein n=1 Tax=Siphoviridae sp. ctYaH2 TaxID=2825549 RepID=A0A8S5V557_9CAUD|nr:MAG TPA: hypothetical protein [Siphoviridae sp. ctYaH2]